MVTFIVHNFGCSTKPNNGNLGEKAFLFTWQFCRGFLVHLKKLALFRGQKSLGTIAPMDSRAPD